MNYLITILSCFIVSFCNVSNKNSNEIVSDSSKKMQPFSDASISSKKVIEPSSWKGVNLPLWIDSTGEKNITQQDFDLARDAGSNVVRLAVHADVHDRRHSVFFDENNNILSAEKSPGINQLKQVAMMAEKDNLKLIIDMHTLPGTINGEVWNDTGYWRKVTDLWATVALAFKDNVTVTGFDLMNEPSLVKTLPNRDNAQLAMRQGTWSLPNELQGTSYDYKLLILNIIKAIEKIDPDKYIIVEGFGIYGSPVNFNWMPYFKGFNNIVYSFHLYIPEEFTGLQLAKKQVNNNDNLVFNQQRDIKRIMKAITPVINFQRKYNVPIYVGEFGLTDDAISSGHNGACWLNSVINIMQQNNWGWTYWDFFGARRPKSKDDPRYVILSAAMKGQPIKNYCN